MRAITVKQPWAYSIFRGGKDVENRSQNLIASLPIELAIHVSRSRDPEARFPRGFTHLRDLPEANDVGVRGKIIGVVTLIAIAESHDSVWYQGGRYAYVFENPRLLKTPLEARGFQSHWEVPAETMKKFKFQ
jgi:hypothetical protein